MRRSLLAASLFAFYASPGAWAGGQFRSGGNRIELKQGRSDEGERAPLVENAAPAPIDGLENELIDAPFGGELDSHEPRKADPRLQGLLETLYQREPSAQSPAFETVLGRVVHVAKSLHLDAAGLDLFPNWDGRGYFGAKDDVERGFAQDRDGHIRQAGYARLQQAVAKADRERRVGVAWGRAANDDLQVEIRAEAPLSSDQELALASGPGYDASDGPLPELRRALAVTRTPLSATNENDGAVFRFSWPLLRKRSARAAQKPRKKAAPKSEYPYKADMDAAVERVRAWARKAQEDWDQPRMAPHGFWTADFVKSLASFGETPQGYANIEKELREGLWNIQSIRADVSLSAGIEQDLFLIYCGLIAQQPKLAQESGEDGYGVMALWMKQIMKNRPQVRDAAMYMVQELDRRRPDFIPLISLHSAYLVTQAPELQTLLVERFMRGSAAEARVYLAEIRASEAWHLKRYEPGPEMDAQLALFNRLKSEWPEFGRLALSIRSI